MDTQALFGNITFDHAVEFTEDDLIFAAGKEHGTGDLQLFLIFNHTGRTYRRNGSLKWEPVDRVHEGYIRVRATGPDVACYKTSQSPHICLQ